jgi:hypothetical protein
MSRSTASCGACGRTFWVVAALRCPACAAAELTPGGTSASPAGVRVVPFVIDRADAIRRLEAYVAEAPVPLGAALRAAVVPVALWVPHWVLDVRAVAHWSAEIGFEERSRASAADHGTRWEPRAGTLDRWHDRVEARALAGPGPWAASLAEAGPEGRVPPGLPRPLDGDDPVLLPDVDPTRAWPDAERALRTRLGAELARAAGGQRFRALDLDARWEDARWTCLLIPVWTAGYVDRSGRAHVMVVDGRTGATSGPVLTSAGRARFRAALWVACGLGSLAIAAVFAVPGILIWPLLLVTVAAGLLGFALCAFAVVPLAWARSHDAAALRGTRA